MSQHSTGTCTIPNCTTGQGTCTNPLCDLPFAHEAVYFSTFHPKRLDKGMAAHRVRRIRKVSAKKLEKLQAKFIRKLDGRRIRRVCRTGDLLEVRRSGKRTDLYSVKGN